MHCLICPPVLASEQEFVSFWAPRYSADPDADRDYFRSLDRLEADSENSLHELLKWKNGGLNLSRSKQAFLATAQQVLRNCGGVGSAKACEPRKLLDAMPDSGPIWSLFLIHCLHPQTHPIFDQHVYRAMLFMQGKPSQELPGLVRAGVFDAYFGEYRPFWVAFRERVSHSSRDTDRALWAFGKWLQLSPWLFEQHSADGRPA